MVALIKKWTGAPLGEILLRWKAPTVRHDALFVEATPREAAYLRAALTYKQGGNIVDEGQSRVDVWSAKRPSFGRSPFGENIKYRNVGLVRHSDIGRQAETRGEFRRTPSSKYSIH